MRELHERPGYRTPVRCQPVATAGSFHGYSDVIVDQDEVFFGADNGFAPDSGYTEE